MDDPARHKTSTHDIVKTVIASVSSRCVNFTLPVLYESTVNPSQPCVKVNLGRFMIRHASSETVNDVVSTVINSRYSDFITAAIRLY